MVSFRYQHEFFGVVFSARLAFSKRSWPYLLSFVVPWLMFQGQRSVTRLHQWASHPRSLSGYYRFLSEGKVRLPILWRSLFGLIVATFPSATLLLVVDDTLCPKWGHRIFGTASYFDHVARPRPGFIWGHNWVVLAVVVRILGVPVALPFWIALYRPASSCPKGTFRTRLELVAEALQTVKTWTSCPIRLLGDGAYFNASLLQPLEKLGIEMVSRLRADAVLRRDPPVRPARRPGRRPRYGTALPRLDRLGRSSQGWQTVQVHIYRAHVRLQVRALDAWWPACGRKIRVAIVKDPKGRHRTCYLTTTDLTLTPEQIIENFAYRWSIEQLFSDVKTHLGFDSAEVRAPRSVLRHAALAFALATWTRVWHFRSHSFRRAQARERARASDVSFRRQIQSLREEIAERMVFQPRLRARGSPRYPRVLAKLFAYALTAA